MACDHGNTIPQNMNADEAEQLFAYVLSGKMTDDEIAEILVALKEKGETKDEILGAIRAIRSQEQIYNYIYMERWNAIDVCGTGGDGLDTLNISTAVAFVLAGSEVNVAKHGNKGVSSKSGSSDVLKELGVNIEGDQQVQMEKAHMCFMFAPLYHPVMKVVAEARAKLKSRTIFNLLGPLLNPAHTKRQLIGVYDSKYLRTFAEVLRELGTEKAWIVHGAGGLDEISISGETEICELDKGAIDTFIITPEDAGLKCHPIEAIKGGDAKYNANELRELLNGKKGAYRDIVLLNAAAALLVAEKVENLEDGVAMAAKSIDEGAALRVVDSLTA